MTTETKFYVGQGPIWVASRDGTGQTSGFVQVGRAESLAINTSQDKISITESHSGNRLVANRVITGSNFTFNMVINNIDGDNLGRAFYGSNTVNPAGSVTDEAHTLYNGGMEPFAYPGVSSVIVTIDAGVTTLVEDTDYTLDAVNGNITILATSTLVVDGTPEAAEIDYSYEANNVVEGAVNTQKEYIFYFEGINSADSDAPVLITFHRVALDMSTTFDAIGNEYNTLTFEGELLPDSSKGASESAYFKIVQQ